MVVKRLNPVFALTSLLAMLGWPVPGPAPAADALVAVGDELAVGKNLTGETCKLRLVESRSDLGGYTRYYAGARSLLVSHWAVATQPTVVLTTTLFDAYGKNAALGRAAALRTAQLKLMGEQATSHPSFWAPFVLVGDGGTP